MRRHLALPGSEQALARRTEISANKTTLVAGFVLATGSAVYLIDQHASAYLPRATNFFLFPALFLLVVGAVLALVGRIPDRA
jgi:hypothetical protein